MSELRFIPPSRFRPFLLVLLFGLAGCEQSPPTLPPPPAGLVGEELTQRAAELLERVETSRLDFGTKIADRRLGEGWLPAEMLEDGTTFVWAQGEASSFEVDLIVPKDLRLRAHGWPFRGEGSPDQRIAVSVNGEEVGDFRMPPGLKTSTLKIPRRFFVAGANLMTFRPSFQRAEAGQPPISAAWDYVELSETQQEPPNFDGERLRLPLSSRLEAFLQVDGEVTLIFDALVGPSSSRLKIHLESDDSPETPEFLLAPQATPGALALGSHRGLVRLSLTASHPSLVDDALVLLRPRLVAAPPPQQAAAEVGIHDVERVALVEPVRRPNVILYLIDTLRADRLGCYNVGSAEESASPKIDAFAADSLLFENTSAQSSWTRASMASIMTGYRPSRHGVEMRRDALPDQALTLAELLSASGYQTVGVITNGNAGAAFGMAQGFDSFELIDSIHQGEPGRVEQVHQRAKQFLDSRSAQTSKPFFLYLHTMEPHAPYVIRERLPGDLQEKELDPEIVETLKERGVRIGGSVEFGSVLWVQALFHRLLPGSAATAAEIVLAYDAAIRHNDRFFGELIKDIEARGLLEQTVIILLSDHGEEFYDHGSWSHGMTLYEEQLRVPFILRLPGGNAPRGVRSQRQARQVDLLPTLLDYLSLPTPPDLDGSSLIAPAGAPPPGFADLDLDGRRATTWIEPPYKLICDLKESCRLFDLEEDAAESQDLASSLPVTTTYLKWRLFKARARAEALSSVEAELDAELEKQLEALGYI